MRSFLRTTRKPKDLALMHQLGRVYLASFPALLISLLWPPAASAQHVIRDGFEDVQVASVVAPSALAVTSDGRLLIASQYGQLFVYQDGALRDAPVVDLADRVCAYRERGLVGLAVDPEFA